MPHPLPLFALLALACASKEAPVQAASAPAPTPAAAPGDEPAPHSRATVMHFHQSRAASSLDALVGGDLAAVTAQFQWMVANPPPVDDLDPAAADRVVALAARPVADLDAAGLVLGAIGAECGTCHARVPGGPAIAVSTAPVVDVAAGHASHQQRAVELLWQGLIAPDDTSWDQGRTLLAEAAGLAIEGDAARYVDPGAPPLREALDASGQGARGEALGALLASCGRCHAASASSVPAVE